MTAYRDDHESQRVRVAELEARVAALETQQSTRAPSAARQRWVPWIEAGAGAGGFLGACVAGGAAFIWSNYTGQSPEWTLWMAIAGASISAVGITIGVARRWGLEAA